MLETGKNCVSCGDKKFLKDFDENGLVCNQCEHENRVAKVLEQADLRGRFESGDSCVSLCECGDYFISSKTSKKNNVRYYKECRECRVLTKKEKEMPKESAESIGKTKIKEKEQRPEDEPDTKRIEKKNSRDKGATMTAKQQESERPNTSPGIEIKSEHTKEIGMSETKGLNSQESYTGERSITQPLDSKALLTHLKEENSNSMNLIRDSARQLIESGRKLTQPMKDSEEYEVIRSAPNSNIQQAVKCYDTARNLLNTQLEYLKFARQLAKDVREDEKRGVN